MLDKSFCFFAFSPQTTSVKPTHSRRTCVRPAPQYRTPGAERWRLPRAAAENLRRKIGAKGRMAVGWYNPLYGRVVSSPYRTTNQGLICSTKFNICFPWSLGVGDLQRERIVFRFPTSTFQRRTGFIDWVSDLPTMSRFFVSRLNLGNGDPLPYCQMRIFENYV